MIRRGVLAGVVLLLACGIPTRVDTLGPDFDGKRTIRLRGNLLPTPLGGIGAIELNAERIERPEQPAEYALLVEVRGEKLRIREGQSLRVMIDGDTVALARDSLARSWPRVDPTIEEQARYAVADSVLRRFGRAAEVRIAVRGAGWWERRRLSPENLETLRTFAERYLDRPAEPPDTTSGG